LQAGARQAELSRQAEFPSPQVQTQGPPVEFQPLPQLPQQQDPPANTAAQVRAFFGFLLCS